MPSVITAAVRVAVPARPSGSVADPPRATRPAVTIGRRRLAIVMTVRPLASRWMFGRGDGGRDLRPGAGGWTRSLCRRRLPDADIGRRDERARPRPSRRSRSCPRARRSGLPRADSGRRRCASRRASGGRRAGCRPGVTAAIRARRASAARGSPASSTASASASARPSTVSRSRSAPVISSFCASASSAAVTGSSRKRAISRRSAASPASAVWPWREDREDGEIAAAAPDIDEGAGLGRDPVAIDEALVEPRAFAGREDAVEHLHRRRVGIARRRHRIGKQHGGQRRVRLIDGVAPRLACGPAPRRGRAGSSWSAGRSGRNSGRPRR